MDEEAERLVAALGNLTEGACAVAALIAFGERAIAPLRRFLLEGRPSTVYQPRRWAVQALGGLGAREVLMEYLTSLPPAADPQLRLAEEAVQNAAIREFLRWPGAETTAFLLGLSGNMMRAGLVEVFGKLRVVEAIPYLDRALEDDGTRLAAEEALVAIGAPAREALILSAITPLPKDDIETPSSLRRRQSALHVLAAIGIRREDWPRLGSLVLEEDPEIVTYSCMLAVKAGAVDGRDTVIARLIAISGKAPWFLQDDIVECLVAWFDTAQPAIQSEIERRMRAPEIARVRDQALRLLLRVRRRAQSEGQAGTRRPGEHSC
jgi:hypothetical protein